MLKELRIVDNFYQTSAYFPMPTILVGTVSENGKTNLGSYSLCFPYYIAGKDYYAMILECRNSSNTAQNILRGSKVSLNFIVDDRKYFREAVRLGFPGETTDEKMEGCIFPLGSGVAEGDRPQIVTDAYQVFECTWDATLEDAYLDKAGNLEGYEPPYRNFNGITSKFGAHFILKIDKILMQERYRNAIINGVKAKDFPPVPITAIATARTFGILRLKSPFPKRFRLRKATRIRLNTPLPVSTPKYRSRTKHAQSSRKFPAYFLKPLSRKW